MSAASRIKQEPLLDRDREPPPAGKTRATCVAFVGDNQTHDVVSAVCDNLFPGALIRDGGTRAALEYLAGSAPPEVLIVDVTDAFDPLTAMLPIVAAFEQTRVIAIGAVNDITLYRELVEAGVKEYLVKPVIEKTLIAAVARLEEPASAPRADKAAATAKRPLIAVMGARGGVGASTIALNSAWLIAQDLRRRVCLLDLDLHCGTLALSLDIEPTRGLREALEYPSRIDSLFISSATAKVNDYLTVMAAEETVDHDVHYDASAVDLLVDELGRQSDCIVVDLPRSAAAARTRVLAAATDVILVTDLTLAGLRDSIRLFAVTQQMAPGARVLVIANRTEGRQNSVTKKEFERALGHSIDYILPEDGKAAAAAANSGKPIAATAPKSKTVACLRTVVATLVPFEPKAQKPLTFWQRMRKAT